MELSDSDREVLARVAHQLWCDRMVSAGWRRGVRYDAGSRTHDALAPFAELDPTDRWTAAVAAECSGALELLAACLEYPRGAERFLRPEEMRVGMAVARFDAPDDVGLVESWAVEDERVTRIRVRWPDGERTEHHPEARELQRAE